MAIQLSRTESSAYQARDLATGETRTFATETEFYGYFLALVL
jgi:hypothetical protein